MAWSLSECVVWYVGEGVRPCGRWPCYWFLGTVWIPGLLQQFVFMPYTGRLWRTSGIPLVNEIIEQFSKNRVRDRCNLVLEAEEIHLTKAFDNQQQGAQGEDKHSNTSTRRPLTGKQYKQQQGRQVPHRQCAFNTSTPPTSSNESGIKATIPRYDTVTNAAAYVDVIYDLRPAQSN